MAQEGKKTAVAFHAKKGCKGYWSWIRWRVDPPIEGKTEVHTSSIIYHTWNAYAGLLHARGYTTKRADDMIIESNELHVE